jgi:hypothetical protein
LESSLLMQRNQDFRAAFRLPRITARAIRGMTRDRPESLPPQEIMT